VRKRKKLSSKRKTKKERSLYVTSYQKIRNLTWAGLGRKREGSKDEERGGSRGRWLRHSTALELGADQLSDALPVYFNFMGQLVRLGKCSALFY
jgi:hypothetical protein